MENISQIRTLASVTSPDVERHDLSQPIVDLNRVSVNFKSLVALDNISFTLQRGERVAVVGPNGAGKSTLFKVVAGLLTPSQGQVAIHGSAPDEHVCISYVPQRSQVDWHFPVNVADVVMMGRVGQLGLFKWPKRRDWEYVYESLALVDMADLAKRQIGELSGGQQQRVFIARALAQEAALMLMDEPFNGLDIKSQEDIFEVMETLRHRQVTVLVSTHDLNLAGKRFDRLMLLNRQLVAFGNAAHILQPGLLQEAYGGQMQLLDTPNGKMVVTNGYYLNG